MSNVPFDPTFARPLKDLLSDANPAVSTPALPASVPIANLAGFPGDKTRYLAGDGSWTKLTTLMPPGVVVQYGAASAPSGWLLCDGSAVSRTTYADLFGVIGTTYGTGDGSTTFNLPDGRGRMLTGYAASGGHADVSSLGNSEGASVANRRPVHYHIVRYQDNNVQLQGGEGGIGGQFDRTQFSATPKNVFAGPSSAPTNGTPLDAPSYLVVNHIIKT